MTHSHDTATPALSVESEYVLVPKECSREMFVAMTRGFNVYGGLRGSHRALVEMFSAAPAPNPSPAAKGGVNWTVNDLAEGLAALHGEGVSDEYREKADHLLAHLSFCASAACSPAAKGVEAEAIERLKDAVEGECEGLALSDDQARAILAHVALATSSPQPANAVREALTSALKAWDECPDYALPSNLIEKAARLAEAVRAALSTPTEGPASQTEGMGGDAVREVQVKPLEWVKHPTVEMWRAETELGLYKVAAITQPSWAFEGVLLSSGVNKAGGTSATGVEAKAAAQDDYARRILAALASDPAPAGEAVEPVAWRWRMAADRVWNYQEDRQRIPDAIHEALYAHPAPEDTARLREDAARLDWLEANPNADIIQDGGLEGDPEWVVYLIDGGRNDREWHELARGVTAREAIDAARSASREGASDE